MTQRPRIALSTTIVLSLFGLTPAVASTIDFNSVVFPAVNAVLDTPTTADGFIFSSDHYFLLGADPNAPGGCVPAPDACISNGTQFLGVSGGTGGHPVTMTQSGGGTFSLTSLDAGRLFAVSLNRQLEVLGELQGGGTVSA